MKLSILMMIVLSATVVGCSSSEEANNNTASSDFVAANEYFDMELSKLVEQLTRVEQFNYQEEPIAFTTLVWVDTLTYKSERGLDTLLGHQISTNLKTALVQQGANVIEHKSSQAISVSDTASYYLTRQINDLSERVNVSYVLAGTLIEIKNGVEINIEVIDINSHQVVSSARSFIPDIYLPERNVASLKQGKIHREQQ